VAAAAMADIAPQNETEAMLAAQMVAVHAAAMGQLQRLKTTELLRQHDCYGNLATKLLRTYAAQVEALYNSPSGAALDPAREAAAGIVVTSLLLGALGALGAPEYIRGQPCDPNLTAVRGEFGCDGCHRAVGVYKFSCDGGSAQDHQKEDCRADA